MKDMLVPIVFALAITIIFGSLFVMVYLDSESTNQTHEDINSMECPELLEEIKANHTQNVGYVYLETWVEKECWR